MCDPPAVAGMFYPADAEELARDIQAFLAACEPAQAPAPKALIVPHAGYIYSGAVAASAYALLAPARSLVRRVVLLGPAHRVPSMGWHSPPRRPLPHRLASFLSTRRRWL